MIISAYFANNGVYATNLSPLINIRDIDNNLVVSASAMTELADGFYKFDFVAYDSTVDYVIICDGGATLIGSERYAVANSGMVGSITDIKTQTDDLPSGVPKGVALSNFEFLMIQSIDHISPALGKSIDSQISKDGGAFAACTNSASEVSDGIYKIDLTAAEMNADVITLKFTENNVDQRTITILTSD